MKPTKAQFGKAAAVLGVGPAELKQALIEVQRNGWVLVEERLPTHDNDVLIYHSLGDSRRSDHAYDVAACINGQWIFPWDRDKKNNPPRWTVAWKEIAPFAAAPSPADAGGK